MNFKIIGHEGRIFIQMNNKWNGGSCWIIENDATAPVNPADWSPLTPTIGGDHWADHWADHGLDIAGLGLVSGSGSARGFAQFRVAA